MRSSSNFGRAPRKAAWFVFAATLAAYLATAGGSLATQDAVAVYFQTKSIVERGAIDVPFEISGEKWLGVDGRYHLPFGIGQALYNVPFYAAGKLVVRVSGVRVGGSDEPILKACVALGNTVAAALCVALAYLLAWRISNSKRAALTAALMLAFGSPIWLYGKFGFNAAVTAAALLTGIYGLYSGRMSGRLRPSVWGAVALGFAVLTRHEMMLAGLAGLAWVAFSGPRRDVGRLRVTMTVGAILAVAALTWMGFNWLRFGNPMESGHTPAFGLVGFAGLIVSPAASLFLYAPVALIGLMGIGQLGRNRHPSAWLLGGITLTLFVFYAALEDWIGTRSYGPRYLVPVLPLLYVALPAGFAFLRGRGRRLRAAAIVLAGLSVVVQVPAVAMNFVTVRGMASVPTPNQAPFSWASSPLVLNGLAMGPAIHGNWQALSGGRTTFAMGPNTDALPAGTELSSRLSSSLDFWWLYLFYLGKLTATRALVAPIVLMALSAVLFWRVAAGSVPPQQSV